jgi:hypothetical protein
MKKSNQVDWDAIDALYEYAATLPQKTGVVVSIPSDEVTPRRAKGKKPPQPES